MTYTYQLNRDCNGKLGWLRTHYHMGGGKGSRWAMRQYVGSVEGSVDQAMRKAAQLGNRTAMRYYPFPD